MTNALSTIRRYWSSDRGFISIVLGLYVALLLIGVLRHEMWRDELQAWCIARDSATLLEVHQHLFFEGHPIAWYLPLFVITRFTADPVGMQILNVVLSTAACFVFLKFAPFSRLQRALFCFSYFPLFEYGIISRSYSAEMLLLFVACWFFKERKTKLLRLFVVLILLASVNAYGLMFALAFNATLIVDYIIDHKSWQSSAKWILPLFTILVFAASGLSLYQMTAPANGYHGELSSVIKKESNRPLRALMAIPVAYAPVPDVSNPQFWNTNLISQLKNETALQVIVALALLCCISLLCTRPIALFLYLLGTAGLVVFSYIHLLGGLRQQGHLFFMLLCCLWIAHYVKNIELIPFLKRVSSDRWRSVFLTVLIVLQMFGGLYSYYQDLLRPFSAGKQVARFIKENGLEDMLIIGSNDHEMVSVSGYLNEKIFYPESETYASFVVNNTDRHNVSFDELFERSKNEMERRKLGDAVLILNYPLGAIPSGFKVAGLNQFDKSIQADERFYVYRISLQPK